MQIILRFVAGFIVTLAFFIGPFILLGIIFAFGLGPIFAIAGIIFIIWLFIQIMKGLMK